MRRGTFVLLSMLLAACSANEVDAVGISDVGAPATNDAGDERVEIDAGGDAGRSHALEGEERFYSVEVISSGGGFMETRATTTRRVVDASMTLTVDSDRGRRRFAVVRESYEALLEVVLDPEFLDALNN